MTNQSDRAPAGPEISAARYFPVRMSQSKDVRASVPPPHVKVAANVRDLDESDPSRQAIDLVQRGRIILDVSAADLEASEAAFGPVHPTTWHFRNSLSAAQRSWDRLREDLGAGAIEAALAEPPLTVLSLDESASGLSGVVLILIGGKTYRPQRVAGTELAPVQWRLTRLRPPLEHGPYYVCRLADGSTQCDCADWTYQIAESQRARTSRCKHVEALAALGWI
jgi:hypothetical protein